MTRAQKALRVALGSVVASSFALVGFSASAAPVTYERLLSAKNESHNWLLPYGSYDAHNSSALNQINRNNIGDLRVKFMHAVGGTTPEFGSVRLQGLPLVNDGFMYMFNPWGKVFKIDVRSGTRGQTVWVNDAEPESGDRMRGSVALLGDYVYSHPARYDMRLLKIDANSGETVWEQNVLLPEEEAGRLDQRISIQPMAVKDRLLVVTTGTVRRNAIMAYGEDGDLLWRFWTIPGPGEAGHESWGGNWDAYMTGGAAVWTQGSFDPETNLVLYGTGEPSPWYDPEFRPGDNLYSVSVVAIDVDTGALGWYFQEIPDESWDYDTVSPRMLYDITVDGVTRKVQGNFSRNGHYYTLDRASGDFMFAEQYVSEVNWTAGLDPKTGMPVEYDPNRMIQSYANNKSMRAGDPATSVNVCPLFSGAATLQPPTYDAKRMTAYLGTQDNVCYTQWLDEGYPHVSHVGKSFSGRQSEVVGQRTGAIFAVDVRTGELVNKAIQPLALYSGVLGTAGDLLFIGHLDGKFAAYDKDTLAEVWSFNTGTPISAPAITYMVDGKQYVAVHAGGQDRSSYHPAELGMFEQASQIVVFGL